MADTRLRLAIELMTGFAMRTGLAGDRSPRRYLWTDAFAVCIFLALARATGEGRYAELALRLVQQVHRVLGRHRADDARRGWLSGLEERAGEAHPTVGGLRIGKPLPERGAGEPMDDRLEWERDGQYFHYLTKWMHALDQTARVTGQGVFNVWARELAATAARTFTYVLPSGRGRGMYWKLSIDLSRPQVASMGQHDPLDGLITCLQLEATAAGMSVATDGPRLTAAGADFSTMIVREHLATADPLGLGGLLTDACRLAQLLRQGAVRDDGLLAAMLAAAAVGVEHYAAGSDLRAPAGGRLAFREVGLAIGLAASDHLTRAGTSLSAAARAGLTRIATQASLRQEIEAFWCQPVHRQQRTWRDHEDISDVMLATSLVPDGFVAPWEPCAGGPPSGG